MSFIGGGSDLKEFYSRTPGCVISTTINKYMYIFIHPFFDDRIQIKYSKTELVNRIEKIKHPIVRETLKRFDLKGIDINSIADLPAGTGLGSSSSYTVGLLHALYTYTNQNVSPELLARIACETEIEILKEPIGKQDQYAAAYGGLNLIRFFPDGKVKVESLKMKKKVFKQLQENLLLFYTGTTRSASDVLSDQKYNILNEQSKYDSLVRMTELVEKAYKQLCESNLEGFGKTLDENWQLKKSLSNKISNTDIDDIYSLAIKNGALGGKLLGAGGGGFLLFYCNKEHQAQLRNVLNNLKEIEFKFEMDGTKSIAFKA
jgi:D-glycero-alpha-D-manno-heptose-7-phosphate kinase